ncbi:ABC transporter substrate-binding protein [Mesorhizobium sp. INR15]|uniref:substrate-binding periplasmic protein n=1 Tax=Mesorhizobium sp. INR15 TaxID=2654248 RepID=UPI0018968554|nr:transporter substrate-binding domain-containing protein [Mesorhizobium sp. INR15]
MTTVNTLRRMPKLGALIATAVVTLSAGSVSADTLDNIRQSKILRVCGVDGLLPYSSSDASTPGFEVEIAGKMAEALGAKAEPVWVSWDALIPALTSDRCDAIINGLFITPEREKVIAFSAPYYASGETILVRKDNDSVHGLADLNGKRVGVLAGSVTVQHMENKKMGVPEVYPDQNTIILELNNGRIDAAYLEAPSAAWVLAKDPTLNIKIVDEFVPDERFNAGVGLRKGDESLKKAFDEVVTKLRDDGTIKNILHHYQVPFFPIAN